MSLSLVKILLVLISLQVTDCKWTIDHYGIDLIVDAATNGAILPDSAGTSTLRNPAAAITAWDADVGAGEPWINIQVPSYGDIRRKAA